MLAVAVGSPPPTLTPTFSRPRPLPMSVVLKRGTRTLHAEAERWVPLVGANAAWSDYRRYLAAMHAICAGLEGALERVPGLDAALPDWAERKKAPLLARDLAELAAMARGGPPLTDHSPGGPRTLPEAFGALYVVEGSTLGGRILARHVAASLGVTERRAGAFLHAYGVDVGARWRTFGRALDAFAVRRDDRAAVLGAARATFSTITRLLARGRAA